MRERWNVVGKWHVSPYNYAEEVRAGYDKSLERITIRDVTLSEGQHQPGVRYTLEGMLRIARALYEAGIPEIKQHVGDFQFLEFIKAVKRELPHIKIGLVMPIIDFDKYREALSLCKKDLDMYIDTGIDEVNFPGYFSWSCPKSISDAMSREARLDRFVEMTQYARSKGIGVELGHVDATRAAFEDLKEYYDAGMTARMTRIGLYDSYGCATPDGMQYLASKLRGGYKDVDILSHAHNDLGSADATTIGGILGGATSCDLSVNGLGDRAGNASLEQVVLQLEACYGIKTGVKLENLLSLCRLVEEETGIRFPYVKPISGRNVFTHESEAHAKMVLEYGVDTKYVPWAEPYSPQVVGGKRTVRFGGTSLTGDMIRLRMNWLGLNFGDKEIEEVSSRIKNIFVKQDTDISLEEFDAIAKEVCKDKMHGKKL